MTHDPTTEFAGAPLPLPGAEGERIPERIGPYEIIDRIASGMALVYKARQIQPDRIVALKLPRGGRLLSPSARQRFLREIALASSLDHPAIVPVLDAGEADGVPFYTMPFIDGRNLADHIAQSRPDLDHRIRLFQAICRVVETLHQAGMVHRDLKPGNILIDRFGEVRLLDFGLARAVADNGEALTAESSSLGTLAYMAPEQTCTGATITPAADVYALGVMLYELLTGMRPYDASGPAALEIIRTAAPRPPSKVNAALGTAFDAAIAAALRKDPSDRPAHAGLLARQLEQVQTGKPPKAISRPRARIRWAAGVIALLALAAGTWMLSRERQQLDDPFPSVAPAMPHTAEPELIVTPSVHVESETIRLSDLDPSANPLGREQPLPRALWPLRDRVQTELARFDRARQGAVIFVAPGSGELAMEGEAQGRHLDRGAAHVIYAGEDATLNLVWNDGRDRRTLNSVIRRGEIQWLTP